MVGEVQRGFGVAAFGYGEAGEMRSVSEVGTDWHMVVVCVYSVRDISHRVMACMKQCLERVLVSLVRNACL